MTILFLHGWRSVPGGVKPTFLAQHGHEVANPKLPEGFEGAVRIAQAEFDRHQPAVVVGSSLGGAVAMNIDSGDAHLVLLCPAWKRHGTAKTVKPGTVVLHSRADDVVPFADSEELVGNSGLPASALVEVGDDHRLADPESLKAMLQACQGTAPAPKSPTFGIRKSGTTYTERSAAYAIVLGGSGAVAAVRGPSGRFWLPGGGSLPGESAEDTVAREVREELARGVRLRHRIGEATQFFYAANDDRHYRMVAVFFLADFTETLNTQAEHELAWLSLHQAGAAFLHECHGWALDRAVASQGNLMPGRQ
jgi:ADP-ribose pyrophosphatase YjhB (NUDIX family)